MAGVIPYFGDNFDYPCVYPDRYVRGFRAISIFRFNEADAVPGESDNAAVALLLSRRLFLAIPKKSPPTIWCVKPPVRKSKQSDVQ